MKAMATHSLKWTASRFESSGMMKRSLRRSLVATMLAMSGCASYHPLPLPDHARLVDRIGNVRHTLPASATRHDIDVGKPLSVDDIGLLAVLNDPELRTERGEFALAQADLTQSKTLPNPSIGLTYAALLGGEGTTDAFSASLTQDVKSILTYRRRVAAAQAHVSQIDAELLWKEWQVAQKARLLAVDLYWDGRSEQSSEAALDAIEQTASRVQKEVDAGEMSQSDLAPLLASKAALEQSISSSRLSTLKNWADLDALLGMTPNARFALARPQPPALPPDLDAQIAAVAERRPDLIALRLGYRSADENVRAAILGQFPALVLGGSWSSDTSDVRSGGPTVTFDLPIFDRNQGQIARTQATRRVLYEQYQSRLDEVDTQILALVARSRQIAASLDMARDDATSADTQAARARQAFNAGTLDRRALIEVEMTALTRRRDVYNFERALAEARTGLALALGSGLPRTRLAPQDPGM
ncbi:TolC family protein [Trinickia sp. NRRL B-1857]|uniref:TolC family protein n=1 Tax=Trinickia sp. NRRL B-1857 TaxID=3162879 RepID=UPI003D27BC9C